jgi:hypothetical protein
VERYKFNGTAWGYEYTLNNSGFTADQWAAINSMITSGLVAKLSALPTNADLLAMLAQKQDNLTFDSTPTENSTNPATSGGVFAADKALSGALAGLRVSLEAYPELKANQNFLQLQTELADIENKLAAARRFFNSTTREFNNACETFPSNIIAGMFNFKRAAMYEAMENRATLEKAPEVKF